MHGLETRACVLSAHARCLQSTEAGEHVVQGGVDMELFGMNEKKVVVN